MSHEPCLAKRDSGSWMFNMNSQVLPHCVYVLMSSRDGNLYIGYTADIKNRLADHDAGRTQSTSYRRPLYLVFAEFYPAKDDALRREQYFKTNAGKRALKLMLKVTLEETRREWLK